MQIGDLGTSLKKEQQQHDLTKVKLNRAEASLRDAIARQSSQKASADGSASEREQVLADEVQRLTDQLSSKDQSPKHDKPATVSEDLVTLRKQLQRAKAEVADAEGERKRYAEECSDLRHQLTQANQKVLVCFQAPCACTSSQLVLYSASIRH